MLSGVTMISEHRSPESELTIALMDPTEESRDIELDLKQMEPMLKSSCIRSG